MLQRIFIQNYAIIDHLDLNIPEGLNIITGETGAGKSILLGALGLIMGKRADSKVLYDQERKCIVEAEFDISEYNLKPFFEQEELDYYTELTLRREIAPGGKSRAFINDTPVTLEQIQQLTENLVVIHQQFDMLDIQKPALQLEILDALADNATLLAEYRAIYRKVLQLRKELEQLRQKQHSIKNEYEFLSFQVEELDNLALKEGELEEIEHQLALLNAAEEIKKITLNITNTLEESEISVNAAIRTLMHQLESISHLGQEYESMKNRLHAAYEELADIAKEAGNMAENTEYDPKQIEHLQERLNHIYRLLKKHGKTDGIGLIALHQELRAQLTATGNIEVIIADTEKALQLAENELKQLAEKLHLRRKAVIADFEKNINAGIRQLGMEYAGIQISLEKAKSEGPSGIDEVTYLFASNKGSRFLPLKDIASGGEISRLTLCIKSFVAGVMTLPTLIFDEIDTGVSGEIARKMGNLLANLAEKHQVVAISHAPQIAAKASTQFFVYKKVAGDRTITAIRKLEPEERKYEIAKMLSGDPPTETALANAAELLRN